MNAPTPTSVPSDAAFHAADDAMHDNLPTFTAQSDCHPNDIGSPRYQVPEKALRAALAAAYAIDHAALLAEVERLKADEKQGGIDYLRLMDRRDELHVENQRLKKRVELVDRAVNRWVPCPDHRDKTKPDRCYVCALETAERERERDATDLKSAVDLVATFYSLYEDGDDVYDEPLEDGGGSIGKAINLDDDTEDACISLLNRLRPREYAPTDLLPKSDEIGSSAVTDAAVEAAYRAYMTWNDVHDGFRESNKPAVRAALSAAFPALTARIAEIERENETLRQDTERLRAFAHVVLPPNADEWGDTDMFYVQEAATEHGLLRKEVRDEPCGEGCSCAGNGADFPTTCYRFTELYRGDAARSAEGTPATPSTTPNSGLA